MTRGHSQVLGASSASKSEEAFYSSNFGGGQRVLQPRLGGSQGLVALRQAVVDNSVLRAFLQNGHNPGIETALPL